MTCCRSSAPLPGPLTPTAAPGAAPDCPHLRRPLWTETSSEEPSPGLQSRDKWGDTISTRNNVGAVVAEEETKKPNKDLQTLLTFTHCSRERKMKIRRRTCESLKKLLYRPYLRCCVFTFDSSDGVLSVLWLVLCGLPLRVVLHRMLVHARIPRQQTHVVFLTVVADGSPVTLRLLERSEKEMRLCRNA